MKYYFIYSAGGGAGDWNGVKRVWNEWMPIELKSNILLKFGDVFYNHSPGSRLIKPQLWNNITNLRTWLYEATQDEFVLNDTNILLDSGTSKIVNYITHNNPDIEPEQIIEEFDRLINENNIFEKYVNIINDSSINYAVTFDIPNTFKIRSQNGNTRRTHFNQNQESIMVDKCIEYCNRLYDELGNQDKILTTFSATWSINEIIRFIEGLNYTPNKLAIGGVSDERNLELLANKLNELNELLTFSNYETIHFLGCGGFKKVQKLKEIGFTDNDIYSVDNSTPLNRAIDGAKNPRRLDYRDRSAYIGYNTGTIHRIIDDISKNSILDINDEHQNSLFSREELTTILNGVLEHQSDNTSNDTYNERAKLSFHNHDVFRQNSLE